MDWCWLQGHHHHSAEGWELHPNQGWSRSARKRGPCACLCARVRTQARLHTCDAHWSEPLGESVPTCKSVVLRGGCCACHGGDTHLPVQEAVQQSHQEPLESTERTCSTQEKGPDPSTLICCLHLAPTVPLTEGSTGMGLNASPSSTSCGLLV